jgi:3-oxoacyl-[acyl-carrier protein] reductase
MTEAIVVTGATGGLGLALTEALLAKGNTVVGVCRHKADALRAAAENIGAEDRVLIFERDLTDRAGVARLFHDIEEATPCRALINNAACAHDGLAAIISPAEMEEMTRVNFLAPMLLCRAAGMHMARRRQGSIVNITSVAAHRALRGLSVYGATKAALEQFSRALARELGPRGVRVNCVAPGFLETRMSVGLTEDQKEQIVRRTPLQQCTSLEDVCAAVIFLLSDAAEQITGQTLLVDGGFSL